MNITEEQLPTIRYKKFELSGKLPQLHATVTNETYNAVKELADKEKRTLSSMASILIEKAIKERNRKKTNNQ